MRDGEYLWPRRHPTGLSAHLEADSMARTGCSAMVVVTRDCEASGAWEVWEKPAP